ncbi:MAG: glycosyltransferase family 2 protein [Prevotella sp.]|nr:glycosyltransferase family 2 protein [Prevotella sp.]
MKVSIIIPVYNVAPYIKRCLDSVAAQTYTGDMECLLIDDCGTDDSIKIAKQWIEGYNGNIRFTIFYHSTNQGLSAARNTGIEIASGDYIYFLDSDDAITPDCIQILSNLAVKYPDADLVLGNTVKGGKELVSSHFLAKAPLYVDKRSQMDNTLLCTTCVTAWNRLVKRSFIIQHAIWFPVGIVHEDVYWLFFLAKHTHKATFTNVGTYCYYANENSVMHSLSDANMNKRAIGYQVSINAFVKDILQNGSTSKYQRQFVGDTILSYLYHIASCRSISLWFRFWQYMISLAFKAKDKFSLYRLILFLATMPPFCLFIRFDWWRWRVRHFVTPNV